MYWERNNVHVSLCTQGVVGIVLAIVALGSPGTWEVILPLDLIQS
jgi:hypothetical protein